MANASEEEWISMFRMYMEGGAGGSVFQIAEVFDFLRIRVPCACTRDKVDWISQQVFNALRRQTVRLHVKGVCYKWWKGRP